MMDEIVDSEMRKIRLKKCGCEKCWDGQRS